jgi:hypothetical protein
VVLGAVAGFKSLAKPGLAGNGQAEDPFAFVGIGVGNNPPVVCGQHDVAVERVGMANVLQAVARQLDGAVELLQGAREHFHLFAEGAVWTAVGAPGFKAQTEIGKRPALQQGGEVGEFGEDPGQRAVQMVGAHRPA